VRRLQRVEALPYPRILGSVEAEKREHREEREA
jgi:hypothetical protein